MIKLKRADQHLYSLFSHCAMSYIEQTPAFSLCSILNLTHEQTPLRMADWTQAVKGSGLRGEVQVGLNKGRQTSIFAYKIREE